MMSLDLQRDSHSDNDREPPSESFQLNLEDNMLNDEEKVKLKDICSRYPEVFAKDPEDIGLIGVPSC